MQISCQQNYTTANPGYLSMDAYHAVIILWESVETRKYGQHSILIFEFFSSFLFLSRIYLYIFWDHIIIEEKENMSHRKDYERHLP